MYGCFYRVHRRRFGWHAGARARPTSQKQKQDTPKAKATFPLGKGNCKMFRSAGAVVLVLLTVTGAFRREALPVTRASGVRRGLLKGLDPILTADLLHVSVCVRAHATKTTTAITVTRPNADNSDASEVHVTFPSSKHRDVTLRFCGRQATAT